MTWLSLRILISKRLFGAACYGWVNECSAITSMLRVEDWTGGRLETWEDLGFKSLSFHVSGGYALY